MSFVRPSIRYATVTRRHFSNSHVRRDIKDVALLPGRTQCLIQDSDAHDLLSLKWPRPLRNILIVRKDNSETVDNALIELATHIQATYPDVSLILEPHAASAIHSHLPCPVYTSMQSLPHHAFESLLAEKVDLTTTLGGDGTILHASSLFSTTPSVPPILSFSMGTLGFLGEWKFAEYKHAFRQVYMSGAVAGHGSTLHADTPASPVDSSSTLSGWSSIRGKSMGPTRTSKILLRNRLRIGISSSPSTDPSTPTTTTTTPTPTPTTSSTTTRDMYAMNEVLLHRGRAPHLSVISIFVGGRFLTEAVADGMLVSTPTGSTAYNLSAGGSIVHPLVNSLCLTPICPRSLSFRPLLLPANTPVCLRLSERNRGDEVDVSVDGVRLKEGLRKGMEVRVVGEERSRVGGSWVGGVPSVVRAGGQNAGDSQDHWVGGLNALLKFNYPFGEDG